MKGQIKTLEAVISVIILISAVFILASFSPKLPEVESLDIKLKILKGLKNLDENNELRKYVYLNDSSTLEQKILQYIPKNFEYKVLICNKLCSYEVNAKKVYTISYFLASDLKNFETMEVLVYVWQI